MSHPARGPVPRTGGRVKAPAEYTAATQVVQVGVPQLEVVFLHPLERIFELFVRSKCFE